MAPLTWHNVAAPDFSGAISARRLVGDALNNGFGALQNALESIESSQLARAKYADEHRRALLGDETVRLQNEGYGLKNQAAQFDISQAQRAEQERQARLAAEPEAAKLLADARILAGSGNPDDVEKARSMITEKTDLLIRAGMKPEAIPGLLDGERTAGQNAFGYKQKVLQDKQFWERQGISEEAQKIAFEKINTIPIPGLAIEEIQKDQNIKDPRVKAQAIKLVELAADDKVFYTPSEQERNLARIGIIVPDTPAEQPRQASSLVPASLPYSVAPLLTLTDRTEGAANYDTLFGHAQRGNSPFAGIQVSRMTLGQLDEMDRSYGPWVREQLAKSGQNPRIATPMGRYQIVGDTRRQVAKELGFDSNTVFSPEVQDAMFLHLVNKRISGPRTMEGKIAALRQEWEGFKSVPDATLAAAIQAYESGDKNPFLALNGADAPRLDSPSTIPSLMGQDPGLVNPFTNRPVDDTPQRVSSMLSTAADEPAATTPGAEQPEQKRAEESTSWMKEEKEEDVARKLNEYLGSVDKYDVPTDVADQPPQYDQQQQQQAQQPQDIPQDNRLADPETVLDTALLDQAFNGNAALIEEFQKAAMSKETAPQVAARLVAKDGLIPSGNEQAVLAAIKETIDLSGGNLNPAAAGALVAAHAESRDLRRYWDPLRPYSSFFTEDGDEFSTENENRQRATRTNMDKVKESLNTLGIVPGRKFSLGNLVRQVQLQRDSGRAVGNLAEINKQIAAIEAEMLQLQLVLDSSPKPSPAVMKRLQKLNDTLNQLRARADIIDKQPGGAQPYSSSLRALPTD